MPVSDGHALHRELSAKDHPDGDRTSTSTHRAGPAPAVMDPSTNVISFCLAANR